MTDNPDLDEAIEILRNWKGCMPGALAARINALLAKYPERPKLLPCPFCGWKAHLDESYGKVSIECGSCGAKVTRETIDAERRAIDAWNRRATPASGPLSGGKGE